MFFLNVSELPKPEGSGLIPFQSGDSSSPEFYPEVAEGERSVSVPIYFVGEELGRSPLYSSPTLIQPDWGSCSPSPEVWRKLPADHCTVWFEPHRFQQHRIQGFPHLFPAEHLASFTLEVLQLVGGCSLEPVKRRLGRYEGGTAGGRTSGSA